MSPCRLGMVAILPWIGILVVGWEIPTTQDKVLLARVSSLESQIQDLNEQIESLKPNRMAAGPTASETQIESSATQAKPTATLQLTPAPSDQSLVVVVPRGNVRAGPGMGYKIIGAVKEGDIIANPLGRDKNGWYRYCCLADGQHGWVGPIVVKERNKTSIRPTDIPTLVPIITPALISTIAPIPTLAVFPTLAPLPTLAPISNFNDFDTPVLYTKHKVFNGIHIRAPADVDDRAMEQAWIILHDMMSAQPELLTALAQQGLEIILFDNHTTSLMQLSEFKDWELAGLHNGGYALNGTSHTVAAPEQRLRCSLILTHEIAHAIDYAVQSLDSSFAGRRDAAYQNAKTKGKWVESYAKTNTHEYWAVAVSHWFHSASYADRLARIDPEAVQLIKSVFGDAKLSSQPCRH